MPLGVVFFMLTLGKASPITLGSVLSRRSVFCISFVTLVTKNGPIELDTVPPPSRGVPSSQNSLGGDQRNVAKRWRNENGPSLADAVAASRSLEDLRETLDNLDRWIDQGRYSTEVFYDELAHRLDVASVRELANVATTLIRAEGVPSSTKQDVGWPWQLCGWRHCGPLADAEKALSVLTAQNGMLRPQEARFLIDVARRSVDEARGALYLAGPPLWEQGRPFSTGRPYLSVPELELVLGTGSSESTVEAAMAAYETEVLAGFLTFIHEETPSATTSDAGTAPTEATDAQRDLSLILRLAL